MNFSAAVKEQMEGRLVRLDYLVEFRFASSTVRLWNGFGPLGTQDSKVWEGLAGLGSLTGLQQAINGTAPEQTLTLSGVDARFASIARGEREEYYGRAVLVYLQFFDEAWQTLDSPYAVSMRLMDRLTQTMAQGEDGPVYTVSVSAETPFVTRRRPGFGYLTDRDQQQRYPGDRGLERVAGIDQKTIIFPDY